MRLCCLPAQLTHQMETRLLTMTSRGTVNRWGGTRVRTRVIPCPCVCTAVCISMHTCTCVPTEIHAWWSVCMHACVCTCAWPWYAGLHAPTLSSPEASVTSLMALKVSTEAGLVFGGPSAWQLGVLVWIHLSGDLQWGFLCPPRRRGAFASLQSGKRGKRCPAGLCYVQTLALRQGMAKKLLQTH